MDDIAFSRGPARRPVPRVADPLLQWSTGLQTTDRRIYAGWLAQVGRNPALDDAMERAGFQQVTIRHGSGNVVTHWAVEVGTMFVVADGVQSISEMQHTTDRYGIAFGWGRHPTTGRQQSQIRFRAFLQELLAVGFQEPLLVTAKGTLTGDVITALTQQYEVLDTVDAFRKEGGKPALNPPFYACSIPLGPGQEVARGTTQTKEITPIVAQIPSPITKDYIAAHWVKRPWVTLIEGIIDQTIAWSLTASTQIAAGEDQGSAPMEEEPEAVRAAPVRAAQTNGHARRQVEDDLL
jgi:hypothetical protein